MALALVGEPAAAMAVLDCRGREGRERRRTRVGSATVTTISQVCPAYSQSRDTYGASVGVSGLEGGSGISIRVGVAIAKRQVVHADGFVPASSSSS